MKRSFSDMKRDEIQAAQAFDYLDGEAYEFAEQALPSHPDDMYYNNEKMEFEWSLDSDTGSSGMAGSHEQDDSSDFVDAPAPSAPLLYAPPPQPQRVSIIISAPKTQVRDDVVSEHMLRLVKADATRTEVRLASRNVVAEYTKGGTVASTFSKAASMVLVNAEAITGLSVTRAMEIELPLQSGEEFEARTAVLIGSKAERVLDQRLFGTAQKTLSDMDKARYLLEKRSASFSVANVDWRLVQTKDCNAGKIRAPLVLLVAFGLRYVPPAPAPMMIIPQQPNNAPLYAVVDDLARLYGDRAVYEHLVRLLHQSQQSNYTV